MYLQKYYHEGNGKLCFEALETEFVPQNNLPCRELKNTFRSQGFL
jgi:hypothetical protein